MLNASEQEDLDFLQSKNPEDLTEEDFATMQMLLGKTKAQPTQEDRMRAGLVPRGYESPSATSSSSSADATAAGVRQTAPTVSEGIGELRKPLAMTLTGIESIPQEFGAVDIQKPWKAESTFPYIGVHPEKSAKLEADVNARYERILEKPSFLEDILTDPTTYIPGVGTPAKLAKYGKYVPRVAESVTNAAIQTGSEVAQGRIEPTTGNLLTTMGVGTAVGAVAPTAAKYLGGKLKSGAVNALAERMKLNNKLTPADYAVLFEDKQIPSFGGNEAILNKVEGTIKDIGSKRNDEIKKIVAEGQETKYDQLNFINDQGTLIKTKPDDISGFIDTHKIRNDIGADLDEQVRTGKLRSDKADEIELLIDKELADLEKSTGPYGLRYTKPDGKGSEIIPALDRFMNRKSSDWYEKGKVGTKAYDELTTSQAKAYNLLSHYGAKEINANPNVADFNKQFSKYLPLEDAMQDRLPVWSRNTNDIDLTRPGSVMRPITSSNAILNARYGAGEQAKNVADVARRFAIPATTNQVGDKYRK